MKLIKNICIDTERAFYKSINTEFDNITIKGEIDGESQFKESRNIFINNSNFYLRYPFWHNKRLSIDNSNMYETCRAAIWYCDDIIINNSMLNGIKVFRECNKFVINNSSFDSKECFWFCNEGVLNHTKVESEYPFFMCKKLTLDNFTLKGKYSFQYVSDVVISNSYLDTKDAFWHAKNVYVKNSTIKGEYLAWYCENVTFENCKIIGTQPLCYCKDLKLIDCEMIDCDLAFEYSDVNATITNKIISIKNPKSGKIIYKDCEEIILDENFYDEGIEIIKM